MSITRDPGYPSEYAQLMAAMNKMAEGHDGLCVLNASLQMLSASIQFHVKEHGMSLEEAQEYVSYLAGVLAASVKENYQRQASSSDIAVRPAQ